MEQNQIEKEMTIEAILTRFPLHKHKLAQEMMKRGLHCIGCHAATWESLEEGMLSHGSSEEDIEEMVVALNAILAQKVGMAITLTARAADQYRRIAEEEGKKGWGLRLLAQKTCCGGIEYALDYSEKAGEEDQVFATEGVELHIRKELVALLAGTEIDFVEGPNGAGFKISHPPHKKSCGCGCSC